MSFRPIQVEVTLYLGQTDPGSWDVELTGLDPVNTGSKLTAAPIWFEICGVVDPGKKIQFSKQISQKFYFFKEF